MLMLDTLKRKKDSLRSALHYTVFVWTNTPYPIAIASYRVYMHRTNEGLSFHSLN
jgi:hypothetical protein